jgi:hypothetical protein
MEVEANRVTTTQPRYSKEEFARRGDEIYQSQIRSQVEEGNDGKIVAIDLLKYDSPGGEAPPTRNWEKLLRRRSSRF